MLTLHKKLSAMLPKRLPESRTLPSLSVGVIRGLYRASATCRDLCTKTLIPFDVIFLTSLSTPWAFDYQVLWVKLSFEPQDCLLLKVHVVESIEIAAKACVILHKFMSFN